MSEKPENDDSALYRPRPSRRQFHELKPSSVSLALGISREDIKRLWPTPAEERERKAENDKK